MRRIAGGLVLAAGLLTLAPAALANDAAESGSKSAAERKLEEVLAELEAQRLEIDTLKAQLGTTRAQDGVEDAVKKYLESDAGMKLLGKNKDITLNVNGRIMYDMIFPDADSDVETAVGPIMRANRFRRSRLELSGTIHKDIYYAFQVEFGSSPHTFRDMFIGMKNLPVVGNVTVGYQKEPFMLEELTSSKYITFMERSIVNQAFIRGHRPGIMVHNSELEDRLNWAFGVFGDADDGRGTGETGNTLAMRVVGTPIFEEKGSTLLHVGASYQKRDPEGRGDQIRSRPGISTGPRVVDSGGLDVDTSNVMGLEAASVFGPFSVQGEYVTYASSDRYGGGDFDAKGYYLFASYFLTGENRPYKGGSFQRVKPKANYGKDGGMGAWELGLRYANLDLDDGAINGGELKTIDVGVNWYLNPNARIMLSYTMADTESLGDVNTIAIRFQVDF